METFSKKLNKLLKDKKISKYKLAKEIGVSNQAICYWCDGINEPKITYLVKIANFFNISTDYLLGQIEYSERREKTMLFHERIGEVIKGSEYSQKDIAKILHISESNITNWKKGDNLPSVDILYRLCILLKESADYLLGL